MRLDAWLFLCCYVCGATKNKSLALLVLGFTSHRLGVSGVNTGLVMGGIRSQLIHHFTALTWFRIQLDPTIRSWPTLSVWGGLEYFIIAEVSAIDAAVPFSLHTYSCHFRHTLGTAHSQHTQHASVE